MKSQRKKRIAVTIGLYRRFQVIEGVAEPDREAIIMVVKRQTRQIVEEIDS